MNKKGWIRIVEAFLAAIFILVIAIVMINQQSLKQPDSSSIIYNSEISIIRNIEMNNTLRGEILNVIDLDLPLNSDNITFPSEVKVKISSLTPSFLSCGAQICNTNDSCNYWKNTKNELYSQDVLITANLTNYNPRKLKLFCTTK